MIYLVVTFPVGEDEVIESDLSAEEFVHVHFVCVECAEQNLAIRQMANINNQ